MNRKEYCAALEVLGLTVGDTVPVFGISIRHAQRLAAGHSPVPNPLRKLIRSMIEHDITPQVVEKL